jgi:hypothetical protein
MRKSKAYRNFGRFRGAEKLFGGNQNVPPLLKLVSGINVYADLQYRSTLPSKKESRN